MADRLTTLLQLLEHAPGDAFTLFAIAKEYEGRGDDATALSWYEKLRNANPAYVGLYYHLGKLHERAQRLKEAVETYDQGMAAARAAGNTHAWSELSAARLNLADPDETF